MLANRLRTFKARSRPAGALNRGRARRSPRVRAAAPVVQRPSRRPPSAIESRGVSHVARGRSPWPAARRAGARRRCPRSRPPTTSSSTSTRAWRRRAGADHEQAVAGDLADQLAVDPRAAAEGEQALELGARAEHGHGVVVGCAAGLGAHVRRPSRMVRLMRSRSSGPKYSISMRPRSALPLMRTRVWSSSRAADQLTQVRVGRGRARGGLRRAFAGAVASERASASAARTESGSATMRSRRWRRRSGLVSGSSAFAWPIVSVPARRRPGSRAAARAGAGGSRSSSGRGRRARPISSCVAPVSARARNARASSIGLRSRRCTFSTSATSSSVARLDVLHDGRNRRAARALRRAPAPLADDQLVARRAARARTTTGWSTP